MIRFVRAPGFAAAVFTVAVTATFAVPSQAGEAVTAPVATHYTDHAAANIESSALSTNMIDDTALLSAKVDPSAVIEHEAAPVEKADRSRSLSELVSAYAAADVPDAERECLAGAIYFESKGEPLGGQLAVAEVIINRAQSGKFPKSLCGVVKQRGQFSFIRGGRFPAIARGTAAWRKAVAIAHIASNELARGAAPAALFFHATRVSPSWKGLKRVATVGNHVFYR